MNIFTDGLSILWGNGQMILVILLIIVASQFAIHATIKKLVDEPLSSGEYFSLAAAGWMLPASLISLLWYLLKSIQIPLAIILVMVIVLFAILLFLEQKKKNISKPELTTWVLPVLVGIFIILRLAFASKIIMPMYFDSAQHYLYIKNFTESTGYSSAKTDLAWLITNYYHLGFHLLTAFITTTVHTDIKNAMLILGQIILAVTPISLFFIIKHETRSNSAGIFTVLLASFGWYMPAYAMNWGKYPALASLPLIQFVLSIAYLSRGQEKKRGYILFIAFSILISIFFHSRSLVIFGIAFLAWAIALWRQKLSPTFKAVSLFIFIIGIILEIIFIQRQDILKPLLDPYISHGLLITSIVLILAIFAIKFHPNLSFACIAAVFMLIGGIFIPITKIIPGHADLTLLDRPFVEMILYLPLSILGGLGLAGLFQFSQQNIHLPLDRVAAFFFIGLIIINTYINYDFYPSDCCNIANLDDLTVIDWMDKNLPANARILISTTELVLLPSASSQGQTGTDTGIWISPLTDRATIPMPYNSNFDQRDTLAILCKKRINYIYIGGMGQSFNDEQIKGHTDWYKPLLSMPKTKVYQVVGCD